MFNSNTVKPVVVSNVQKARAFTLGFALASIAKHNTTPAFKLA